jgi:tRNA threonylcarbamoyladenosine biosynthesis protein TsaB
MLLLVTDTSGKNGFVGLARAEDSTESNKVEVIEEAPLAGGTFSAQLVPQIAGLLEKHGLNKIDIDAFVVISGPGSFTGLRVGLAAIKALAEILHKPIVAVSLLEVIARSLISVAAQANDASEGRYTVALDAGRGEAFIGLFKMSFAGRTIDSFCCESESLVSVLSLAESARSGATPWIVTPDATLGDALKQRLDIAQKKAILFHARPHSAEVASVGWHKLKAGETVSPEQLEANYIRRSDAEIFSKPASSS